MNSDDTRTDETADQAKAEETKNISPTYGDGRRFGDGNRVGMPREVR